VAIHDKVFKRLFKFYADLLDPEEFKRSGPNVTAFNDLSIVTSTGSPSSKPFSDFSMTYGFDNFYSEMDVNLDITKDFTIFAVVKIDFNVSRYYYLQFHMGAKRGFKTSYNFIKKENNVVLLQAEFSGTNNFLDLTGDNRKFINKQIMLWSTKKGNKLSTTIAGIDLIETTDSQTPTHYTENIHFTSIKSAYLVRMGFTTNSYAIGGDAFHAMVATENKLGTYFGLD